MVESKEIVCTWRRLGKFQKAQGRMDPTITAVIALDQKIVLTNKMVISRWRLEEVVEDIYNLEFQFADTIRSDNLLGNCSHYQVQKNPDGRPVLIRVPK